LYWVYKRKKEWLVYWFGLFNFEGGNDVIKTIKRDDHIGLSARREHFGSILKQPKMF
jgi:hypothetical protein